MFDNLKEAKKLLDGLQVVAAIGKDLQPLGTQLRKNVNQVQADAKVLVHDFDAVTAVIKHGYNLVAARIKYEVDDNGFSKYDRNKE